MNRKDFLKQLKAMAEEKGLDFKVNKKRGKGSHYWVQVGTRGTTVPQRLTRSLCKEILKQLDLDWNQS